jgi:hypothetical protein
VWKNVNRNVWRVIVFLCLILAIIGPWWFDQIYVPSKYTCSSPFIRLEGDFCGKPMSGIWIFVFLASRVFELALEMFSGAIILSDVVSSILQILLYILLAIVLVLPLITTWLLILRGNHQRLRGLHIVAWFVGILCVIYAFGIPWPWALWGLWLYMGVAVSALTLEVLIKVQGRRSKVVSEPGI